MPTLISLVFPSFSQLILCFSVGSRNIFAAVKNCTSPIQFFFNFKHLKFQTDVGGVGLRKDNRLMWRDDFLERDRAKAKHRTKLLLKLHESQELKGCKTRKFRIEVGEI